MTAKDWRQVLNSFIAYRISRDILSQIKFVALITALGFFFALIFAYNDYTSNITVLYDIQRYYNYNQNYPLTAAKIAFPEVEFTIGLVADLDTASISKGNSWISYLRRGTLTWNSSNKTVNVQLKNEPTTLKSSYSHAGRGAELSELVVFNGRLLTFDDRTGLVYEIKDNTLIPWVILTDGNGTISKGSNIFFFSFQSYLYSFYKLLLGFKSEWATVKDNLLYVGSTGKEWTTPQGAYENSNPLWIKVITPDGLVSHINWESEYIALRRTVGIDFPGIENKFISKVSSEVFLKVGGRKKNFLLSANLIRENCYLTRLKSKQKT